MTSPKMWCLLPLALLLLLFICPTVPEVVQSMSQCEGENGGFLLNMKTPEVPNILEKGRIKKTKRYKIICQTYGNEEPEKNNRRFVTLYDTKNKIPVLSAYKYRGSNEGGRPNNIWMIEPQLEDMKNSKKMQDCDRRVTYKSQASDNDYTDSKYDKGHLFPSSYAFNEADKISTFTLTNIVPQDKSFNQHSWSRMETCVKCILQQFCINNNKHVEGYVVIGAQPGNEKINNTVIVPSLLWSAFCCQSGNKWIASAYWGDNVPDKSLNKHLHTRKLQDLYDKLSSGDKKFKVFPESKCPLTETVVNLYPNINANCNCPQQAPGVE